MLLAIGPANLPRLSEIAVDARTLAFAASLSLLVSAGLMIRTFQSIRTVDPGFTQPDNLQILRIFVSSVAPTAEQATRIENAIQDKLASIPGVTSAAFGSAMPMEEFGPNLGVVNFGENLQRNFLEEILAIRVRSHKRAPP